MNDFDILEFFNSLGKTGEQLKREITQQYVNGYITKDEFIVNMRKIKEKEN